MGVTIQHFWGKARVNLGSTNEGVFEVQKMFEILSRYKSHSTGAKLFTFIPSKHWCDSG